MYRTLAASFGIIFRNIPQRSFINQISFTEALGIYILVTVLGIIELFLPTSEDAQAGIVFPIGMELIMSVVGLLLVLFVSTWVINRYAIEKFTLKEMFVLQTLLVSGSTVVFNVSWIVASFFGELGLAIISVLGLAFGIYMLLTFQKAISDIASISKSQAAYVIIAPIALFLAAWIVFLILAGIFATIR